MKNKNNSKVVRTKQGFIWHFMSALLDSFGCYGVLEDEGFFAVYRQMRDYVANKIEQDISGEITDMYMVVEHVETRRR